MSYVTLAVLFALTVDSVLGAFKYSSTQATAFCRLPQLSLYAAAAIRAVQLSSLQLASTRCDETRRSDHEPPQQSTSRRSD